MKFAMASRSKPIDAYSTIVIGAGPTGLAFASRCHDSCLILEKESEPGGLCRSKEIDGAVFDYGGHVFHTSSPQIQRLLEEQVALHGQPRDARIAFGGKLISYPFQHFYGEVDDQRVREECRAGSVQAAGDGIPTDNLHDFLLSRFGTGICQHFLFPYNAKLWGHDLREFGRGWARERVAHASRHDAPAGGCNAGRRVPLVANSTVYYPRSGGFQAIFEELARSVNVRYDQWVREIDVSRKLVFTDEGSVFRWKHLVSTIPIPVLAQRISHAPSQLELVRSDWQHLSLHLSFLVTAEPLGGVPHRIYVHDPSFPFHKVAFNHESSPSLRSRPHHAVVGETSYSTGKLLPPEGVEERLVDFLLQHGLIRHRNIIRSRHAEEVDYAYPLPLRGLSATRDRALEALRNLDIYSVGRFGSWDYVNSDTCLEMGWDLARQLEAGGTTEANTHPASNPTASADRP
jgi:protoporphyrinogen oxidase